MHNETGENVDLEEVERNEVIAVIIILEKETGLSLYGQNIPRERHAKSVKF